MTVVKRSCCSSRGQGSVPLLGSSQLPLLPGDLTPCSGFWGRWDLHACVAHTFKRTHTHLLKTRHGARY